MAKPKTCGTRPFDMDRFQHGGDYIGTTSERDMAKKFARYNKSMRYFLEGRALFEENGSLNLYVREADNSWSMIRSL